MKDFSNNFFLLVLLEVWAIPEQFAHLLTSATPAQTFHISRGGVAGELLQSNIALKHNYAIAHREEKNKLLSFSAMRVLLLLSARYFGAVWGLDYNSDLQFCFRFSWTSMKCHVGLWYFSTRDGKHLMPDIAFWGVFHPWGFHTLNPNPSPRLFSNPHSVARQHPPFLFPSADTAAALFCCWMKQCFTSYGFLMCRFWWQRCHSVPTTSPCQCPPCQITLRPFSWARAVVPGGNADQALI